MIELRVTAVLLLLSTPCAAMAQLAEMHTTVQQLPDSWQSAWDNPPNKNRPLQIVHGMHIATALKDRKREQAVEAYVTRLASHGLGGMVCNMPFRDYMQAEQDWKTLQQAIEACRDRDLVVWLYDEQGYPSGAAGGLVLQEDSNFEALELAFDAQRTNPFVIRKSYEFTHANNNYYASRRYANLIDQQAVACFVDKTHAAYWKRLEPLFGTTIQAMFTDEPSLLAHSLGPIPADARKRVTLMDAPDPQVRPYPAVPWCHDLPQQYQQRFGEDILKQRHQLFKGHSDDDRRVRQQFWELISHLFSERYLGALQHWCLEHGVASSGHTLSEESLIKQVAGEGNGLQALSRMQIPGLDMLSSDPEVVVHVGWLTAGMPTSAASHTGKRRIMTEVSDFSQKMGGQGPASLTAMQATAAWHATWGVTDFTLYYSMEDRTRDDYLAYCQYVGRLNAILKPARRHPHILLYYPIRDLWAEYIPTGERLSMETQSEHAQTLVASFMRLGQLLQHHQIPFSLIDHEFLASATVSQQGMLEIGGQTYGGLLLPAGVSLPSAASKVVEKLQGTSQRRVLRDGVKDDPLTAQRVRASTRYNYQVAPASSRLAWGHFQRDGRDIVLLVNVGKEPYSGAFVAQRESRWLELDPTQGTNTPVVADTQGHIPLRLAAHEAVLLVGGE